MNLRNSIYSGSDGRQSLFDLKVPKEWNHALIIFVHGFMGFKDWGAWNLVQDFFTTHGFAFAKMNLSHNGGTTLNGIDFPDEKAFASNTYSKEVADIGYFRDHLNSLIQPKKTYLIGHSRGGGDVILYAATNHVDKIALWASICDIGSRFPRDNELKDWKDKGERTVLNGRTRQHLPQNYSLYEDFKVNETRLNIQSAIRSLRIPKIIIHGDADSSVPIQEGEALSAWANCKLHVIEGGDHVFGASHPWLKAEIHDKLREVCEKTLGFFK